jgi:hypothetical protein
MAKKIIFFILTIILVTALSFGGLVFYRYKKVVQGFKNFNLQDF